MAQAPPPANLGSREGIPATLGDFQVVRAEAQDWLTSVDELNAKTEIKDKKARERELDDAFVGAKTIAADDLANVDEVLARISGRLHTDPRVAEGIGDEVTHVVNSWNRAKFDWTRLVAQDPRGDEVLPPLVAIKRHLKDVVSRCGTLTIPRRLNDHLEQLHVGQGLDFHGTFEDELPSKEERNRILRFLRDHPAAIDGVIDVEKGRVFKASQRTWRRVLSLVLIALAVLLDYIVFWLIAEFVTSITVPGVATEAERWPTLWHALTAALLGGVAHIFVGALKQSRSRSSEDAFLALDDLLLWAHVREVQLIQGVLSFIVGILGLLYVLKRTDPTTAFFVGYSLDSFLDLFLERFEKTATAQVASLTEAAT